MNFYLVQRMTARTGHGHGFDALFTLDYMGASEFEWGALPKSLKRIRTADDLTTIEVEVSCAGVTRTTYIVGATEQAKVAADAMQPWLDGGSRGKERAYFAEQIAGVATDYMDRTNAWWSLTDDVMFTLDADIAKRLVAAISGGAA